MESTLQQTTIMIPTAGRAPILHETVVSLQTQTRQPLKILICPGDTDSILPATRSLPNVAVAVPVKKGSAAQRNACLGQVATAYILFLDDDVVLAPSYIESMEALFDQRTDIAVAMAHMAADGARTDSGHSHGQARQILDRLSPGGRVQPVPSVIGCNMFVRTEVARAVRFDERLPLYGWLEDLDFSTRAVSLGGIVINGETALVHLGSTVGRTSGLRFGYSQIVNPLYLWKKSGVPSLSRLIVHFWLRLVLSNLAHSLIRSSRSREDRPGRLKGNLLAFGDLLRGRITPERIVSL